jgi:hypothetical protein
MANIQPGTLALAPLGVIGGFALGVVLTGSYVFAAAFGLIGAALVLILAALLEVIFCYIADALERRRSGQ